MRRLLCCCVLVTLAGLAAADLLDLYVQHMDETMRTREYYERRAARRPGSSEPRSLPSFGYNGLADEEERGGRVRRSVLEGPHFRIADPVEQKLDAARRWSRGKGSKPIRRNDDDYGGLDFSAATNEDHAPSLANDDVPALDLPSSHRKKGRGPKKYYRGKGKQPAEAKRRRGRRSAASASAAADEPHRGGASPRRQQFTRSAVLDEEGDVLLEWDPRDDENVTFRLTARTLGYVGLGFNDKGHMRGADILLAWVDDHTGVPSLLDSHGVLSANAAPETDASQDVHLIHGSQNETHTVVTFTRRWQACDPHDRSLTGDTIRVLWALHQTDPELNAARFHGERRGGRALRLRAPAPHPAPAVNDPDMIKWDVKLNQFTVSNTSDTVYWCKIFKAPKLNRKHHMIGYTPLVEKANEALVHHVILYECASTQAILGEHARLVGAHCYSPTMPKEWDSCLQPVLAWARGSAGEWLPEHVGQPVAEHSEGSYYMLEVHYNNRLGRRVVDSSGVRLHLTPNLRRMEAGILVAGVAVSPLHMVPPRQREYATAGYCTSQCTNKMFDEDGINVVSVVLHSHLAGRRLGLKHIRAGKELPPIVQDNHFDFDYQQSHTLGHEVKVLPGDELVAECVYDTRGRTKPTFGGYAAYQEMCLAFVLHYPRTPLAACYSMTPVKEFFNALNVQSFKDVTMEQVEKLFLSTTTETVTLPVSPNHHSQISSLRSSEDAEMDIIKQAKSALISKGDYIDYDDIFARLVIEKPTEFRGHTLSDHMSALAWNDTALSKSIERSLYHGKHVTFCRTREDKLPQAASIQNFPNYTALAVNNVTRCKEYRRAYVSSGAGSLPVILVLTMALPMALLR